MPRERRAAAARPATSAGRGRAGGVTAGCLGRRRAQRSRIARATMVGGMASARDVADAQPVPTATGALCVARGMAYFCVRPALWVKVIAPILFSLVTTIASVVLLFSFALAPQARALERVGWPPWLAWTTSVLCIIAEVALVNLVVLLVLFGQVQSQLFRGVLEARGVLQRLKDQQRLEELPEQCCCRDFGHTIRFLLARLPLLIVTAPLNAMPVLGQLAWVFLNGWLYTWELEAEFMVMWRELYSCRGQFNLVQEHCAAFSSFGAAAMGLEMVPFVGPWIFFASNACGAALLAEEMMLQGAEVRRTSERGAGARGAGAAADAGAEA